MAANDLHCTSLICGMFSSLDQALNPLSLSKLDQKYRMKGVEEQITLQGNQSKLYDANIKIALARIGILEKANGMLSSELKEIKDVLSKSTSLKRPKYNSWTSCHQITSQRTRRSFPQTPRSREGSSPSHRKSSSQCLSALDNTLECTGLLEKQAV